VINKRELENRVAELEESYSRQLEAVRNAQKREGALAKELNEARIALKVINELEQHERELDEDTASRQLGGRSD
jgi:hypothetical protein